MPLTQRAKDWLATLDRIPAVPTAVVEKRIRDAGFTPHALWLDFHDEYAGYVEPIAGGELAYWGLVQPVNRDPPVVWVEADKVVITPADGRLPDGIVCADAHPVHDYELLANGRFLGIGGPADAFATKIERAGVMQDFHARGKVAITQHSTDLNSPESQKIIADMRPFLVPEASDSFAEYYLDDTRLLVVASRAKRLALREIDPSTVP